MSFPTPYTLYYLTLTRQTTQFIERWYSDFGEAYRPLQKVINVGIMNDLTEPLRLPLPEVLSSQIWLLSSSSTTWIPFFVASP